MIGLSVHFFKRLNQDGEKLLYLPWLFRILAADFSGSMEWMPSSRADLLAA